MAGTAKAALARITDFQQVRAIADPLRIRMLQLFAQGPLTTKQVAERLGEKPTRLYNHARTLERAGLVRLVRTRQNRGTTERYLEAVGSRFEIDESLFALGPSGSAAKVATYATASAILRAAASDLDHPASLGSDGPEPLVAQASLWVTPREFERLRARVLGWIKGLERRRRSGSRGTRAETPSALFTVALLPVAARSRASARGNRSPADSA
jgi:DNA-binding transcriptional ArsR family regulator